MPKSSMSHNGTRMWDQMAGALQNLLSHVLAHGASRRQAPPKAGLYVVDLCVESGGSESKWHGRIGLRDLNIVISGCHAQLLN